MLSLDKQAVIGALKASGSKGIWLRMKTGKSLRVAEEAYNEYLSSVGARPGVAGVGAAA